MRISPLCVKYINAFETIGNKDVAKAFVQREVERASDHNKPKE